MPELTYESRMIHYRAEGDGEALLVLPGNTASSAAHQLQLERLGQRYRAVSLDFLGTGRSDRLKAWTTDWWAEGARQVETLLDHLDVDQARLMGTSGGSVVALHAAVAFPDRVQAVVADSFSLAFTPGMLQRNVIGARREPGDALKQFWQHCHGDDWREVVDADTELMHTLVDAGGRWLDIDLGRIPCPVLLTGSRTDPMIPDIENDYRTLATRIPEAQVLLADEGGHPLMWTRPELFHAAALEFLEAT